MKNIFKNLTLGKKILLAIGLLIVFLVTLSLLSFVIISIKNHNKEIAIKNSLSRASFSQVELREDIDYFMTEFNQIHPDPINTFPLIDINPKLQDLKSNISSSMPRLTFYKIFTPLISEINDEHTYIEPLAFELNKHVENNGKFLPLEVKILNHKLYISKILNNDSQLKKGDEILSIDNELSDVLINNLKLYFSGTNEEQKIKNLEYQFKEIYYLVYGLKESAKIELKDTAGNHKELNISFEKVPLASARDFSYQQVSADTMLFAYNKFAGPKKEFKSFLEKMFLEIKNKKIKNLVIDLRINQGGTTTYGDYLIDYLTDLSFDQIKKVEMKVSKELRADLISNVPNFLRWLPMQYLHPLLRPAFTTAIGDMTEIEVKPFESNHQKNKFAGKVYVLVGPRVMSSGSLFTASIKKYNLGTIIGSSPGGYPTFYGNVIKIILPNTGLEVNLPTSIIYGNGAGYIIPDHEVNQTVEDLINSKDTVLDFYNK